MDSDIICPLTGIWQVILFMTKKSFIMKLLKMKNEPSKYSTKDKWLDKSIPPEVIWAVLKDMQNILNVPLSSAGHQSAVDPFFDSLLPKVTTST